MGIFDVPFLIYILYGLTEPRHVAAMVASVFSGLGGVYRPPTCSIHDERMHA